MAFCTRRNMYVIALCLWEMPTYMYIHINFVRFTDILQEKWGANTMEKSVRKKMTQKCTDYYHDKRYSHLRLPA